MKRIFSLLTALVLTVSLVACGGPTWQEQYDLGIRYLTEGNYEEAILAFTAAIEIDDKQPLAYIGRANAYIGSGESEETLNSALADYEQAVELDGTNADAWLSLADIYIRKGDFKKAEEVLREALDKASDTEKLQEKLESLKSGAVKDASGKLRRENCYDENGKLLCYQTYTYDASGRQSRVTLWDASGNEADHLDIHYDERGNQLNWSREFQLPPDLKLFNTTIEYNEQNQIVKEVMHEENNIETVLIYEYNAQGQCTVEKEFYGGEFSYQAVNEYNDQGNLISTHYYRADGTAGNYMTYQYDESGKMTKCLSYNAGGQLLSYDVFDENGQREYDANGTLTWESFQ